MRRLAGVLLAVVALLLFTSPQAEATTYGWKWAETIEVFDATSSPYTRVAEAVREWDRTDARVVLTANRAAANIVVEARDGICGSGCAYFPTITNNVATGTCYATLTPAASRLPFAEGVVLHEVGHCLGLAHAPAGTRSVMTTQAPSSFYRAPTTYDRRDLNRLY